jgi:methionyl-tRNA formyltransferase
LTPPPVKTLAESLGLPVIQPERLRTPEAFEQLAAWAPDLIVVAAYGQILRQNVLDLPRYGCLNVHASLLPRWRGASPIQAAILHGDRQSGVTIMQMEAGLDTGPMFAKRATELLPDDTGESLTSRLAELGAGLLLDTLPDYLGGKLAPQKQEEELATYAKMIQKEEGELDFHLPGATLERKVRAFYPWPSAYMHWEGGLLKVHRAHFVADEDGQAGHRRKVGKLPAVGAVDGWLVLEEVQPSGKKSMPGSVFLNGARLWLQ